MYCHNSYVCMASKPLHCQVLLGILISFSSRWALSRTPQEWNMHFSVTNSCIYTRKKCHAPCIISLVEQESYNLKFNAVWSHCKNYIVILKIPKPEWNFDGVCWETVQRSFNTCAYILQLYWELLTQDVTRLPVSFPPLLCTSILISTSQCTTF